ncbi:MAG: lysoplasmalogenase [Flavobacteriales bacterium]|nr:lysoplasmalogenase [Flavobacteriales bacterium]
MFSSVKAFSALYFGLTLVFLCTIIFELQWLHYATKPLFMILLMVFQWKMLSGLPSLFSKLVQFGLFFSWIGDIALMFDEKVEILFVVGLAAFLIAHLGYAYAFVKNISDSNQKFNVSSSIAMALPFALVTGSFFYYMKGGLPDELFAPVLAYTVVISIMGITSAWRKGHVNTKTYNWILIGAILFILSDMVIAINKFVVDFDYDAIVNMILYLTGQFMIAVGAVYHQQDLSRS